MAIKILNVGQCGFDGPKIEKLLREQLNAVVESSDTATDAVHRAQENNYNLVLVNRILHSDKTSGLSVIQDVLKTGKSSPIMLVSDSQEAQDEAVACGAAPGFGKSNLENHETLDLIANVAGGLVELNH